MKSISNNCNGIRMLALAIVLSLLFTLTTACTRKPEPISGTTEPTAETTAPEEETAAPEETSGAVASEPDIAGKRVIAQENDSLTLDALPNRGSVWRTDAIKAAMNDPANSDCVFNVIIAFYCMAEDYKDEQWEKFYGPIVEDPIYVKYNSSYQYWFDDSSNRRLARDMNVDLENVEERATFFADNSGLVDPADRERFIELEVARFEVIPLYHEAVSDEAIEPIISEKLDAELQRLTALGLVFTEPRIIGDDAGVYALLTPEQVRDFVGDPNIGYLIRFTDHLEGFELN